MMLPNALHGCHFDAIIISCIKNHVMDIFDKPSFLCVYVCVRLDVCLQTNHGPTQILYLKFHA
jgi:hypothetical protein